MPVLMITKWTAAHLITLNEAMQEDYLAAINKRDARFAFPGHTSMLSDREYALSQRDAAGTSVVVYAGNFHTNGHGRVKRIDNKSGHFQFGAENLRFVAFNLKVGLSEIMTIDGGQGVERVTPLGYEHIDENGKDDFSTPAEPVTVEEDVDAMFADYGDEEDEDYGDYQQMDDDYDYARLLFMSGYQEGLEAERAEMMKSQRVNEKQSLLRRKYRN